jgi:hypothetical protein
MAAQTQLGNTPGVPVTLPTVTAQISTQNNPGNGLNSIVQAEQALLVTGPIYLSPGAQNIGSLSSGGGP